MAVKSQVVTADAEQQMMERARAIREQAETVEEIYDRTCRILRQISTVLDIAVHNHDHLSSERLDAYSRMLDECRWLSRVIELTSDMQEEPVTC